MVRGIAIMQRRGNCLEYALLLWQLHNGGWLLFRKSRVERLIVPHVLYSPEVLRFDATGFARSMGIWRRNGGYLIVGKRREKGAKLMAGWRFTLCGIDVSHLVPLDHDYSLMIPPVIFDGSRKDHDP